MSTFEQYLANIGLLFYFHIWSHCHYSVSISEFLFRRCHRRRRRRRCHRRRRRRRCHRRRRRRRCRSSLLKTCLSFPSWPSISSNETRSMQQQQKQQQQQQKQQQNNNKKFEELFLEFAQCAKSKIDDGQ